MIKANEIDWWTVPEAAVWIRRRDMAEVRALGPRERVNLSMATLTIQGAFDAAHECLLPVLREGRVAAYGRGHGLEEIPVELWKGATFLDVWKNKKTPVSVTAAWSDPQQTRWREVLVPAEYCQIYWPMPASILAGGTLTLAALAERLNKFDVIHWLLDHPAISVTGLNDRGERVPIDRAVLVEGTRDYETNTLTTQNERLCWSQIAVAQAQPTEPPKGKSGNKEKPDAAVVAKVLAEMDSGMSPHAAAKLFVDEIDGSSTPDSKIRRVAAKARRAERLSR
jgi:hypothetical protein